MAPSGTVSSLSDAAAALWGTAGRYLYDGYDRFRSELFPQLPAQLPLVIGMTAYGHCIGMTRLPWVHGARVSIAPRVFAAGRHLVDDVLVHELLHVQLALEGFNPHHAGDPWYAGIRRLSPAVLGHPLVIERPQRKSVRVPNPNYGPDDSRRTLVRKVSTDGDRTHARAAQWPAAFRPPRYDWGEPLAVPAY